MSDNAYHMRLNISDPEMPRLWGSLGVPKEDFQAWQAKLFAEVDSLVADEVKKAKDEAKELATAVKFGEAAGQETMADTLALRNEEIKSLKEEIAKLKEQRPLQEPLVDRPRTLQAFRYSPYGARK